MDAFIVRPFGNRPVLKKDKTTGGFKTEMFDFDRVEKELIIPAFNALQLSAGTTQEIWAAGSIHKDMFSRLLVADIVIADITVHNANVFYELGIRHALRDKKTVLLKCPGYDDTPFDIAGYKYLSYDIANPSAILDELIKTISETIKENRTDSPVFDTIPKLTVQDIEKFIVLPDDFTEELKLAAGARQSGKLALLAQEAGSFPWRKAAWRQIGEALYTIKAMDAARTVWEKVLSVDKNDRQATDRLATIYQRLAEKEIAQNPDEAAVLLTKSDLAIEKLLDLQSTTDRDKRAEARALKARNIKTRWVHAWKTGADGERPRKALQSSNLKSAFKQYEQAFFESMNHFYSGINALGLLTTMIQLAEKHPDVWELGFKKKKEADSELDELKERKNMLAVAVQLSLEATRKRMDAAGDTDIWLDITEADLICLIETNPERVASSYTKALEGGAAFHHEAARRQLCMYEELGVLSDNVKAALSVINNGTTVDKGVQYVLFTGHMIDKPGRAEPRFPPDKEDAVRQRIMEVLEKEKSSTTEELKGISGGACGGDILFHEVCEAMGIKTEMYLALPRDQFIQESVQFAGVQWLTRFDRLHKKLPHPVLAGSKKMPAWLSEKKDYSIWERNNLWLLNSAMQNGGINLTLVALWDGKGGDGPGGTADMVKQAQQMGAKVVVIDMKSV